MEGEEQGANPSRESVLQSKAEDLARAIGLSALQRLDLAEKLLTARETRRIEQEDKDKEQERLALLEAYKLQFEAYKNQAFLSSAAVVAFAAITANLFLGSPREPTGVPLLLAAYICTFGGLIATSVVLFLVASKVRLALSASLDPRNVPKGEE
jgi:hypothetical protein